MSLSRPKTYVVEHMEPEMGAWSTLEYIAIAEETTAGGNSSTSRFILSSLQQQLSRKLPETLAGAVDGKRVIATTQDVESIDGVVKARVCLLDPRAETQLSPADAGDFDWFVFGGILGDDPPRELRKYGYQGRNLGKLQMTTDTAARVTRIVIEDQKPLGEIPYTDFPELKFNENESTQMPFRYVEDAQGMPVMPKGMMELIKQDADKSLDDLF